MSDSSDKPHPGLTKRQRTILDVIRASVTTRGYPPSIREIGDAVGLTSTSSVAHQLRTLERKGYLRRDPNRPRAVDVRGADEGAAPVTTDGAKFLRRESTSAGRGAYDRTRMTLNAIDLLRTALLEGMESELRRRLGEDREGRLKKILDESRLSPAGALDRLDRFAALSSVELAPGEEPCPAENRVERGSQLV